VIKVKNIKGSPESIPDKYVGIHSDDNFFYFFETEREKDTFYDSLPKDDSWKRDEIEQEAERLFDEALNNNWYSRFDVKIYAEKGEAKAIELINYYELLWKTIEQNFANNNYNFKLPKF